jgi:hypothetical protein
MPWSSAAVIAPEPNAIIGGEWIRQVPATWESPYSPSAASREYTKSPRHIWIARACGRAVVHLRRQPATRNRGLSMRPSTPSWQMNARSSRQWTKARRPCGRAASLTMPPSWLHSNGSSHRTRDNDPGVHRTHESWESQGSRISSTVSRPVLQHPTRRGSTFCAARCSGRAPDINPRSPQTPVSVGLSRLRRRL